LYSSSRFGTPLSVALKTGDFELIKALQPNNKNKKTNFIILLKLNSKDKDYSKILNYYFSKDRLTQKEKDKLLNKKMYSNDLVMIDFLLKNGAKLDSSRYINENFVYAMRGNNQKLIKHMLKFKNLNLNYKYNYSHTFLRIATECNLETVKLLLEHGATVDAALLKTVKDKKILNYLKSNYTQKGKKDE
jgi:ankyrin repeat protein